MLFLQGTGDKLAELDLLKPESGDLPWARLSYDLSAYAGKKIEIRFNFQSDPEVNFKGVTLDNVRLE